MPFSLWFLIQPSSLGFYTIFIDVQKKFCLELFILLRNSYLMREHWNLDRLNAPSPSTNPCIYSAFVCIMTSYTIYAWWCWRAKHHLCYLISASVSRSFESFSLTRFGQAFLCQMHVQCTLYMHGRGTRKRARAS